MSIVDAMRSLPHRATSAHTAGWLIRSRGDKLPAGHDLGLGAHRPPVAWRGGARSEFCVDAEGVAREARALEAERAAAERSARELGAAWARRAEAEAKAEAAAAEAAAAAAERAYLAALPPKPRPTVAESGIGEPYEAMIASPWLQEGEPPGPLDEWRADWYVPIRYYPSVTTIPTVTDRYYRN